MNKQKFIEFLRNPGELKEQHLAELNDLVTEYPYFQAARALEAKGNRLLKTRMAGKKTASAAVYSTNRILLKKYLKTDGYLTKTATTVNPVEVPPTSPAVKTRIEVKQETIESTEIISSPGSSSIDQLIFSLNQDMKELEKSRAKYIEVTRKIEEEEAVEKAVKKATGSTRSGTSARTKSSTTSTSKSSGSTRASTAKKSTASKKADTTKKATKKKTGTTKSASKTTGAKAKSTTAKKTSTARKTTPKKTATKKTTARSTTKSAAKKPSTTRTSRTTKTTTKSSSKKKEDNDGEKQHELIDQFIKKNPSFKPASEPKNVQDLSEQSTALPEDIGSEYLAEIFLEQGKKEQAIKIYNSLILRFPEKKAYFAGRIKKIK